MGTVVVGVEQVDAQLLSDGGWSVGGQCAVLELGGPCARADTHGMDVRSQGVEEAPSGMR